MSAANLFNIPSDLRSFAEWTFNNAASHQLIIAAVAAQMNVNLASFAIDPVSPNDFQNFLLRHQIMHNEYEPLLGIGGNDFTSIPMSDPSALQTIWILHANSHRQAHDILRIAG